MNKFQPIAGEWPRRLRRRLLAVALVMVAPACALAQSNVQIFGIVDVDVAHYRQGGAHRNLVGSSGSLPSQFGFRGIEDLGGGLRAGFYLESTLSSDIGTAGLGGTFWNRRSTIGLSSPYGELRLGRDHTVSFWNNVIFDPFVAAGPGTATNMTIGSAGNGNASANPITDILISNAVSYLYGFAPNANAGTGDGLYGQAMVAAPENPQGLGKYAGARVGYARGAVNAALAFGRSKGAPLETDVGHSDYRTWDLGAAYEFGHGIRLTGDVGANQTDVAQTRFSHWGIGGSVVFGLGLVRASFYRVEQNNAAKTGADQVAIGYVYNLTKRTALYTAAARIANRNGGTFSFRGGNGGGNPGLAGSGVGTGFDVGMKTSF